MAHSSKHLKLLLSSSCLKYYRSSPFKPNFFWQATSCKQRVQTTGGRGFSVYRQSRVQMNILNIPSFSGILLRSIWSSLKPLGSHGLLLHTYLIIWDLSLMWTWSRKEGQQEPFKPLRHTWLSFPLINLISTETLPNYLSFLMQH